MKTMKEYQALGKSITRRTQDREEMKRLTERNQSLSSIVEQVSAERDVERVKTIELNQRISRLNTEVSSIKEHALHLEKELSKANNIINETSFWHCLQIIAAIVISGAVVYALK